MKEMFVNQVGMAVGGHPVVLLSDDTSDKALPIFIGSVEAAAISMALAKTKPPRPLTHDLLMDVIEQLGRKIESVEIVQLSANTYHARLCLSSPAGEIIGVDCRPSDGIALALRAEAPIFVDAEVAAKAMVKVETESTLQAKAEAAIERDEREFKDFLSNLKASDFFLPPSSTDRALKDNEPDDQNPDYSGESDFNRPPEGR